MPHPYLVPFRLRTSRITHSSGVSATTSTVVDRPFTFSLKAIVFNSWSRKWKARDRTPQSRPYEVCRDRNHPCLVTGRVAPAGGECQADQPREGNRDGA